MRLARWRFTAPMAVLALLAGAALGAPAPGRHDAQLCVALGAAAVPSCGAAEVEWQSGGAARVRVDDISYRLRLRSSQIEVVLMHGTMQIDEFVAPYEWVGEVLRFADAAKSAHYELRPAERKPPKR